MRLGPPEAWIPFTSSRYGPARSCGPSWGGETPGLREAARTASRRDHGPSWGRGPPDQGGGRGWGPARGGEAANKHRVNRRQPVDVEWSVHGDAPRDPDFDELFESVFPLAQRVAYRVVGDAFAAEDIAAEAFVRLYARWGRLKDEPGRIGWILRVTANLAIDTVRRKKPAIQPARPVEVEETVVLRIALAAALAALPSRQRAVVVLRYLADQSEDQVARALGISAGTVKAHAHRATQRLRRHFPDDEEVVVALDRA